MSLADDILETRKTGKETDTTLKTDARVVARVTDGIYRQPGSALRELISNSYDADATEVTIDSDAPRFGKITVTDDGSGMSPLTLAHVLQSIGGSAKRTKTGIKFGISSDKDPTRSPGGRKLIGKIGIGLFSVAQLSRDFQILTKIKGDGYRTVAAVKLRSYSENELYQNEDSNEYESGIVRIWSEPAPDIESQGTSIVVTNIHPQTKTTLRSLDTWIRVENSEEQPPQFHIGKVDPKKSESITNSPRFPFDDSDSPKEKFSKLVDSVWKYSSGKTSTPNLKLEQFFDYYFDMVWKIGLSIPTTYIDAHPFDISGSDDIPVYSLSNDLSRGSSATPTDLGPEETIKSSFQFDTGSTQPPFNVKIDGIEIHRPIKFSGIPTTKNVIKRPLMFVGKCDQNFASVDTEISTGSLKFEAYLFWAPKISPRDHRGSLIRINGASGSLFDDTFLKYQVAELTRLSQITCEIFVSEGLDGALNIDRESFNYSHPHFVYLTIWLHSALRQLATAQKKVSTAARTVSRAKSTNLNVQKIQQLSEDYFQQAVKDTSSTPPDIKFEDEDLLSGKETGADTYVFSRDIIRPFEPAKKTDAATKIELIEIEKLRAITQLLSAYGLLDNLPATKQKELLSGIASIIAAKGGD